MLRDSESPWKAPAAFNRPLLIDRVLLAALVACTCAALVTFVLLSLDAPDGGGFDAWAMWGMHAKFIFAGGVRWPDGISKLGYWSHPDYPLLGPGLIARLWDYAGCETRVAAALNAFVFTFATAALLVTLLYRTASIQQACLAGVALLGTPFFIRHGASQYMDVPVAFWFLLSLVCIDLHERVQRGRTQFSGAMCLAGVGAGCATWTKNEGLLLVVAIVIARFVAARFAHPLPGSATRVSWSAEMGAFFTGALPWLLVFAYLKLHLIHAHELLLAQAPRELLAKVVDPSRYWLIGIGLSKFTLRTLPLLPLVVLYAVAVRGRRMFAHTPTAALVLLLLFLGYVAVYVITPLDLKWQINFSMNRLLLQLWPVALWVCFRQSHHDAAVQA